MFTISAHAEARRIERDLHEDDLAAAMCAKPTLHLADKTAHYHDIRSGAVIVVSRGGVVKTVFRVGQESLR